MWHSGSRMLTMNRLPYVADLDDEIDKNRRTWHHTGTGTAAGSEDSALSHPLCIISGGRVPAKPSLAEGSSLNIYARWFPDNQDHLLCAYRPRDVWSSVPASPPPRRIGPEPDGGGGLRRLEMRSRWTPTCSLCDEVSMMDIFDLEPVSCAAAQLPAHTGRRRGSAASVGPGAVLRELIASRALPVIKLDKVFRQSRQSCG